MTFRNILIRAKPEDETAKLMLLDQHKPMLIKGSILDGQFNEDLNQEQCLVLLKCINQFII